MKKRDLKKLALMGITGGLLIGQQGDVQAAAGKNGGFQENPWVVQRSCQTCSTLSQRGCGKGGCNLTAEREINNCRGSGGCRGIIADNDTTRSGEEYQSPEQNAQSPGSAQNMRQQNDYDPNQ